MTPIVWATIKVKDLHVGNDVRASEQGVASRVLAIHRSREGTFLIRSRLQSFLLGPDDPIEVALEGGEDE
jgi:hypothetical protein